MNDIRSKLESLLDEALTDEHMASLSGQIHKAFDEAEDNFIYHLRTNLPYELARYTEDQAERALKAILEGDDKEMRKYLSCEPGRYTGRDQEHSVIHGKLFETGAIELRKKIVDAHTELLKNERILDLESQVSSLTKQYNSLTDQLERARREAYELAR